MSGDDALGGGEFGRKTIESPLLFAEALLDSGIYPCHLIYYLIDIRAHGRVSSPEVVNLFRLGGQFLRDFRI